MMTERQAPDYQTAKSECSHLQCIYTAKQKLSLPSSRCSKLDAQTCRRFLVAIRGVSMEISMESQMVQNSPAFHRRVIIKTPFS